MASLQIDQATIFTVAERVVQVRQLHGKDSSYTIGILAGIQMLAGNDDILRQLHARILELEEGTVVGAAKIVSPTTGDGGDSTQQTGSADRGGPQETPHGQSKGEDLAENTWIRGAVKWFNNDKGYGFISTDAATDVFVHWRDISSWDRSLTQGDPVEFMVTKTAKGFQAINVMKPEANPAQASDGGETQADVQPPTTPPEATVSPDVVPDITSDAVEKPLATPTVPEPTASADQVVETSDTPGI